MIEDPTAGIETYQKYLAIRNHFKTGYDYFKYNGSVNVKTETYLRRNDKIFFEMIAKRHRGHVIDFFVANFVYGTEYVGSMIGDEGKENYDRWTKIQEGLSYHVAQDVEKILSRQENFSKALSEGYHPEAFKMYLANEIGIHTVVVLNDLTGFLDDIESDPVTDEHRQFIHKVAPFIDYDKKAIAKKLRKLIDE